MARRKSLSVNGPCTIQSLHPAPVASTTTHRLRCRSVASIALNVEKLQKEIAARGVTQTRFAEAAGIPEGTLTSALQGRPVSITTLRRIAGAMLTLPLLPGIDHLLNRVVQP